MEKFVVAEFFSENPITVEVFPSSWLLPDHSACWWPKKCTPKLLKNADSTPFSDWQKSPCRVFKFFGTYDEAHAAGILAENQSDLELITSSRKRNVSERKSSSESEEETRITVKKSKKSHSRAKTTIPSHSLTSVSPPSVLFHADELREIGAAPEALFSSAVNECQDLISAGGPSSSILSQISAGSEPTPLNSDFETSEGFQRVVLRELAVIKRNQKDILNVLLKLQNPQVIQHSTDHLEPESDSSFTTLPKNTENELDQLNHDLERKETRKRLIVYLMGIGGDTVSKTVKEILKRIIGVDLRRSLSYSGKRSQKGSYSKFENINNVIIAAVRKNQQSLRKDSPITEAEIKKIIMDWFRFAPKAEQA